MKGVHLIIGPPGTGKTTRISAMVSELVDESSVDNVMICSLTRAAAAEAAGRSMPIPRHMIGTLHSFAYRCMDGPVIAESKILEWNETHPRWSFDPEIDMDEPDWQRRTKTTSEGEAAYQEMNVLRARMVERDLAAWDQIASFAKAWDEWKEESGYMDFTDLIEVALNETECAPNDPRFIFVDEAQDFSKLELALLHKWAARCQAIILVGDPLQALYEWRGAHPQMFADDRVPESNRTVLSQSYRVPKAVHRVATSWASEMLAAYRVEYSPTDEDGRVGRSTATWRQPYGAIQFIRENTGTIMFQAACSYMLKPLISQLKLSGEPFANPWRRKRADWNPFGRRRGVSICQRVRDLIVPASRDKLWLAGELKHWTQKMVAKGTLARGAKTRIEELAHARPNAAIPADLILDLFEPDAISQLWNLAFENDDAKRLDLLAWWYERLDARTKQAAEFPITVIKRHGVEIFDEDPRVFVGTIHSFKGSEADHVMVWPDVSPSGWYEINASEEGREAACRLGYVAMTRARNTLVVGQPCSHMHMELI